MSILKRLLLISSVLPLMAVAEPLAVQSGFEWSWVTLVFLCMSMVLVGLFALSKAIDTLADRIREKGH
jgi:hypothetical protein